MVSKTHLELGVIKYCFAFNFEVVKFKQKNFGENKYYQNYLCKVD
jgi:hypothetical protein